MDRAAAAGRRACADDGEDGEGPALSYTRAARAVRLTLALQLRLARDAEGQTRAEAARRRDRIHARVETATEAETLAERDGEQLSSDAWERLTEEDDADLLARPMDEVVARICQDLGLLAPPPPCSPLPPAAPGTSPRGGRAKRPRSAPDDGGGGHAVRMVLDVAGDHRVAAVMDRAAMADDAVADGVAPLQDHRTLMMIAAGVHGLGGDDPRLGRRRERQRQEDG
jgi:hypothetical protein